MILTGTGPYYFEFHQKLKKILLFINYKNKQNRLYLLASF